MSLKAVKKRRRTRPSSMKPTEPDHPSTTTNRKRTNQYSKKKRLMNSQMMTMVTMKSTDSLKIEYMKAVGITIADL